MDTDNRKGIRVCAAAGIASAVLLAAWVIYRSSGRGAEQEISLCICIGLVMAAAAAAAAFGRSLFSWTVCAAFGSLVTVGCLTCDLLGLPTQDIIGKAVCALAVFLLAFGLTGLLLRLLEYQWFLITAAMISVLLYVVTLLAAERTGGAALGVSIFGHTMQLFELGKPLYIIVTAAVLCIRKMRPSSKLLLTLGFTLIHCVLLLMQSELGTMLCILAAYIGQLTVWLNEPGAALRAAFWDSWRKFVFLPAMAVVVTAVAVILQVYPFIIDKFTRRIEGWLNGSYQVECGMKAMAKGGMAGVAGEASVHIPYAASDMAFPSVIQQFGLAAGVGLIALYALVGITAINCARRSGSTIVRSVAVGSAVMITVQALIAICASTGLIPMTGITLPFVSDGGVSLSVCGAFAGMIAYAVRYEGREAQL